MGLPRPPLPLPLLGGNRPDKFPDISLRCPVIFLSSKSVRRAKSSMAKKHPLTPGWLGVSTVLRGVKAHLPVLRNPRLVRSGPINNPLILVNTGKSILGISSGRGDNHMHTSIKNIWRCHTRDRPHHPSDTPSWGCVRLCVFFSHPHSLASDVTIRLLARAVRLRLQYGT